MIAAMKLKTLAPWKKSYDNLYRILKSRDITLLAKARIVKAVIFSENWTIKKAKHQRTDAFEIWCWRRLLRVLWTVVRSNQSILKKINPEYSLEGLMLKLKLQYFGHLCKQLHQGLFFRKDPDAGKDWGQEDKGVTEDEMVGCHH